ncbi:MAG: PD-(D/E)XK nuclease family protein, partial [Oscillospiraceae bacterium]
KALQDSTYDKEEVLVQGVIDCVALKGDTAYVIDYKTDRVSDMDTLYQRYQKQLELYRYATGYLFEKTDIKCIIYSFHLGAHLEF